MITPTSWAPGSTVLTGITELTTNDPARSARTGSRRRPVIDTAAVPDAAVVVEDGRIVWAGAAAQAPAADHRHDVGGRAVIPGFVDSHTHAVFAGDRSAEFAARMAGRPYAAGGIGTTVAATRAASDDELASGTERLVGEMHRQGSTTVEIKSGYGLTVADELRQLRIAGRFTDEVTFLGAHVVAPEYADDPAGYVALVTGAMMAACAPHARWVDVFCERGAFDVDQARAVLAAGAAHGLRGRLHANQLGHGPGVRLACELGLAAVDHCTFLDDADLAALHDTGTVATLLPGVEFCTRSPYPDARRLLDAGVTVALATDCNPGTCYSSSMPWCLALAVREMGLTWEEALWAATRGGAAALDRADLGQVAVGARADLVVLDAPSASWLAYRPGVDLVHEVLSPAGP